MSAEAVGMLVLILVSVKRPVTRSGLMSNVVPFPLPVERFAVNEVRGVPPLRAPPAPITHAALVPVALKLPLDWANADPDAITAIRAPAPKHDANFLIVFILVILSSRFLILFRSP
jgi:hypothetical protein